MEAHCSRRGKWEDDDHIWMIMDEGAYTHLQKVMRFFRGSRTPTEKKSKLKTIESERLLSNFRLYIGAIAIAIAILNQLYSNVLTMILSRLHWFHVLGWANLLILRCAVFEKSGKKRD